MGDETPCRECEHCKLRPQVQFDWCKINSVALARTARGCDDFKRRRDRWEAAAAEWQMTPMPTKADYEHCLARFLRKKFPPVDREKVECAIRRWVGWLPDDYQAAAVEKLMQVIQGDNS